MACDTIYGRLTVSQIISYAERQGKNVIAAVNTDFFSTATGVPSGIVIENGIYKSSPEEHTAVAFTSDGDIFFSESPQVTITLTNNGSSENQENSGQTVELTHFNKYRADTGGLYLFSSAFSTVSTRTSSEGWFVRFKILDGEPSVSGTMTLEVVETLESDGAVSIGDGYLVLPAADECGWGAAYEKFSVGDVVTMATTCTDENLANAAWATGGGDVLISGGSVTDSSGWDKAIAGKNPRTAIGVKADGTIVTYVSDGRESDNSLGLKLSDLAQELLDLGCVYAVNLDGGGSSVMSIRLPGDSSTTVVNDPSDGSVRKCAAYLLFVTDAVSDGRAAALSLDEDGMIILSGVTTTLNFSATDSGYYPANLPGDLTAVSSGLGTLSGTQYTAGGTSGADTLTLSSASTGAAGTGTIHVITSPASIKVTKQGSSAALSSVTLSPYDTLQLDPSAWYYSREVVTDDTSFTYEVTGDIGTVSDTGLLTIGARSGITGTVTVRAGDTKKVISVTVTGFSDIQGHWAKSYIEALYDAGIVNGVTTSTYGPELNIKRGDFILMLYRAAGLPAVTGETSFTDVASGSYYEKAITWAESCGIAQGMGGGTFSPEDSLTRQQAFAFVYRALDDLGIAYTDGTAADLTSFSDCSALSDYAVTPTATLVRMGAFSGSGGALDPSGILTRAQMAKILSIAIGLA
jgi:exopolysaccharide biosynthesis protein